MEKVAEEEEKREMEKQASLSARMAFLKKRVPRPGGGIPKTDAGASTLKRIGEKARAARERGMQQLKERAVKASPIRKSNQQMGTAGLLPYMK